MKHSKIYKILGIIVILSLLMAVIPATPVFAATLVATPASGAVGTTVTIYGTGFNPSVPPTTYQVLVYFSKDPASPGQYIGTNVTTYATATIQATDGSGNFSGTFTIPSTIMTTAVTAGNYYFYACQSTNPSQILISTPFTVIGGGEIAIDIDEGPVDTLVEISGSDFSASQPIHIEFGGDEVEIEDGNTTTGTTGSFVSYIAVPEIRAGTHNIDVTIGTGTTAVVETAEFTVTPDIIISPQSGEAGISVSIVGTGFARRENVDVYYNSTTLVVSALTDTRGSFYTTFEIPEIAGLTAGAYSIEAEDSDLNFATTPFTLTIPQQEPTETQPTQTQPTQTQPTPTEPVPAKLQATADGNEIGSIIGINGSGFAPNSVITIKFDDTIITTTISDSNGLMPDTYFQAPAAKAGEHIITATDGVHTGTAVFVMVSVAPEVPEPLRPDPGDKVKSPVLFDWEDVTSSSTNQVTYMLQIATSEDFTVGSIVLEKSDIVSSEYTLTDAEEEELAGRSDPYYWRIQAVDAASNESGWTDAMEVYISPPFSFPKWLLYTLLAIGAVVIFVVGYWLGRRTAFMY
jgi:hypothetical protein